MLKKTFGTPGNLQWKRDFAGQYTTEYWCNGYKYQIRNFDHQDWRSYYMWAYDSEKKWRRTPLTFHKALKDAKNYCATVHNRKPRTKWVFVGRLVGDNLAKAMAWEQRNYEGQLMFQRETTDNLRQKDGSYEKVTRLVKNSTKFIDPNFFREVPDDYEGKLANAS